MIKEISMNKRGFLVSLLGCAALLPLGGKLAAKTAGTISARRLVLQSSPLAGFQFHAGPGLWKELKQGDVMTLRREPENRFDSRAVAVLWNGRQIGYLPRKDNAAVAQLLDRGERLSACIRALQDVAKPKDRVLVEVEWWV